MKGFLANSKDKSVEDKIEKAISAYNTKLEEYQKILAITQEIKKTTNQINEPIQKFYKEAFPKSYFEILSLKGNDYKTRSRNEWRLLYRPFGWTSLIGKDKNISKNKNPYQYIEAMQNRMDSAFLKATKLTTFALGSDVTQFNSVFANSTKYDLTEYIDHLQETIKIGEESYVLNDSDEVARLDLGAICFGDYGQHLNIGYIPPATSTATPPATWDTVGPTGKAQEKKRNFFVIPSLSNPPKATPNPMTWTVNNVGLDKQEYTAKMWRLPRYVLGSIIDDTTYEKVLKIAPDLILNGKWWETCIEG